MSQKLNLLIGYDGSSFSDAILADLPRMGLPAQNVEALILSVADVAVQEMPTLALRTQAAYFPIAVNENLAHRQQAIQGAEMMARRAADQVRFRYPNWTIRAEACAGSPAQALIDVADGWPADLILLGSHGREGINRLLLGSVSQTILTHAHCSVHVAHPQENGQRQAPRLVVGMDGSPHAMAAVAAMAERQWPAGTAVRLVTALSATMMVDEAGAPLIADGVSARKRLGVEVAAQQAIQRLAAAGLSAEHVMHDGYPQQWLLEEAEQWGADAIFVGARGLNRLQRFLLGSVSVAVATRAKCSVEVVRAR